MRTKSNQFHNQTNYGIVCVRARVCVCKRAFFYMRPRVLTNVLGKIFHIVKFPNKLILKLEDLTVNVLNLVQCNIPYAVLINLLFEAIMNSEALM